MFVFDTGGYGGFQTVLSIWLSRPRPISFLGSHKKINYPPTGSIITSHFGNVFDRFIFCSNFFISCFAQLLEQNKDNPTLLMFASKMRKTTRNYASGLFHTYDVPALPRTNNDRESEFRGLNQRPLRTTGQKGATKRKIKRSGAWELIPRPGSFEETISALSCVDMDEFREERQRLGDHRSRFRLHTRSGKRVQTELGKLTARWFQLPQDNQKR